MEHSIMSGALNQRGLQTYLTNRIYDALYFPRFFPMKQVSQLTIQTLIGAEGNRVAADIVSYDSAAPLKRRVPTDKLTTEIPAIRIARKMSEVNLNEYFGFMALANNAGENRALELVFDDVNFVVDGCLARMEWMALQAMSQTAIALTTTNNAGIVTTTDVTFQMPSTRKEYIGSAGGTAATTHYWTAAAKATNDPITDIMVIQREAAGYGVRFTKILMNLSKWQDFVLSTAVQNFVFSVLYQGTAVRYAPTLGQVNAALTAHQYPIIEVIDQRVDIEDASHDRTSTDPWLNSSSADKYVLFVPSDELGNMLWCPTAEEKAKPPQAMHAKKGSILVSKFSETNPVAEFTVGLINTFPSWPKIDQCWSLNTELYTSW